MSDLDDLARALSGGGGGTGGRPPAAQPSKAGKTSKPAKPAKPTKVRATAVPPPEEDENIAYERPVPAGGVSPKTWVWLGLGIVAVLGLAFWLINRDQGPAESSSPLAQAIRSSTVGKGATTQAAGPATAPTTTNASPTLGSVGAAVPAAGTGAAVRPATRPGAVLTKDIEDPVDAIEVYRLKRDGATLDIGVRNISKRGVYVRVLQFYPESDEDEAFGESIRFWLAPGGSLNDTTPIPRLAARLGEDEGVTAFIEDAEFSDTMPDELKELAAEAEAPDAGDEEEEEEPAPKSKKKGKSNKKSKDDEE